MASTDGTTAPGPATDAADGPLLEVRDLKTHFPLRGSFTQRVVGRTTGSVKAVDGVSFRLQRGEVLGLVGESGSGKTTLGRTILRLADPTSGTIEFDGRDVSRLSERDFRPYRRRVQMVFQDPHASLNPAMDLLTAIGHPLKIHGLAKDPEAIRQTVASALERVGLTPVELFLRKYPSDLSGGQKQRAVIARAIILGPDLLIADEPVSMLDMSVRAKILELMLELKNELDLTYLYITHDLATAKFFCDRVAIMYLGRIVEIGPTEEIFSNPRHPYTDALLRAVPDPDPDRQVPRDIPKGEVPDAVNPPLGCSFHPRCPRAFEVCGWESRDLQDLLESQTASTDATDRPVTVGELEALAEPATTAHLPAGRAHDPRELFDQISRIRSATPEERIWKGVRSITLTPPGVTVSFHDHIDPPLLPEGPVSVACHLYDERALEAARRAAEGSEVSGRP